MASLFLVADTRRRADREVHVRHWKGMAMTNPGNHFDGETTPPTNYDGETTPPTAYAASNQQPTNSSKDSNRSKLIGILATLVVVLLVLIGVLLLMFNGRDNEEPAAANGSATTQQPESTTSEGASIDVHDDDVNYADIDKDRGQFQQDIEHLLYRKIEADGAMHVRRALIDRMGELARDPETPEKMPERIDGVDAGPLGEFSCLAHQGPSPHLEHAWSWDCRGPEGRQVVNSAVLMNGLTPSPGVADSPDLLSNGTPGDPRWKERAIDATSSTNETTE
mgnify:FL=1